MPEGPEVATVQRQLSPLLNRNVVVAVKCYDRRFAELPPIGVRILRTWRHGKWLHWYFESGEVIRINLGMSGRFVVGNYVPKHQRWAMLVQVGKQKRAIRYIDPRGFGHLQRLSGTNAATVADVKSLVDGLHSCNLGPDVLSYHFCNDQQNLAFNGWRIAMDSNVPIKQTLMNQSRIAGIGNIYACEICHELGVHPELPANCLTKQHLQRLVRVVPILLNSAIARGGTSFGDANTFRDIYGKEGQFSRYLKVYGKEGETCRCGGTINRLRLAGRSTFFCDNCQRMQPQ